MIVNYCSLAHVSSDTLGDESSKTIEWQIWTGVSKSAAEKYSVYFQNHLVVKVTIQLILFIAIILFNKWA